MATDVDRVSLTLYPELHRLVELRDGYRWVFTVERNDSGEVRLVAGGRLWPTGWSDALAMRNLDDARAFRLDPANGMVWMCEGGLVEVIDGLTELPDPGQPGAPRLVRGAAHPRNLWLPPRARGLTR